MTTYGKIKEINGDIATVEVFKEAACTGKCEDCAGCKVSPVTAKAKNEVNAKIGDIVEIYASSKKVMGLAFSVYVLPVLILIFLAGIFMIIENLVFKLILVLLLISSYICFIIYENIKCKKSIENTVIKIIKSAENQ